MSASDVPTVNVDELQQMLNRPDPPLLLDVRELDEWQFCRIEGAKHLPMSEIQDRVRELEPARQTVVYCHHGVRSEDVAEFLISRGFKRVVSLTEGIDAWSLFIDPIFSPCVTYNHDNDYPFFRERIKKLEDEGHDTSDWKSACEKALMWDDTIYTGLFLQIKDAPTLDQQEPVLDDGGPLARRPLGLSKEQAERIFKRMM